MKARLRLIAILTVLGFLSIILRFFYWQIIKSKEISALASPQRVSKNIETSYRGKILASDGSIIVGQADSWNVFAEPQIIDNPEFVSKLLAQNLVSDKFDSITLKNEIQRIYSLISDKQKMWVPIKNRVNTDIKNEITSENIRGIGFDKDEIRVYPEASSAAHLLGFLGKNDLNENQGYFGLEGYYDNTLSSTQGMQKNQIDIKGLPLLFGDSKKVPSYKGANLLTYIDKGIQLIVDEELKNGIERYGAATGSVIVMNPQTGGIMAMSNLPSFDPRSYWNFSNDLFLNSVISASYEPGSVFKIITMASALDAKLVEPDTKCDICEGAFKIASYEIQTWNNQYYKDSTMTDVIVHSDNVGMVFVAKKMGIEKNYDYLTKFGIGSKTGIDLQGEMTPPLRKLKDWSDVDLVTSSFGQGIAVTPIQMIVAANVIANKGEFVRPKVVKEVLMEGKKYSTDDVGNKRIISEDAANKMTSMMVEAARYGESKWTYKKGYGVAGKTGTAQIPLQGHYDSEKTVASFVGFAPYSNPKFIMLVTLKEPQSSQWASETAAPLWYSIAEKLFLHFGIIPE